ncbi:MAG: hypothetical protein AVDCRST_MAG58-2987 [uncultured Rubrobacteraceae bacterium]|uniref:Uncharacterized protein n=1 Tax=uncultured Rubrobacteraceae bacterium TaxID=349277 RepID=A0A6J4RBV7_9ACTN|nr:MAG: hypothetical protein AVDCRST_MAG58-2987 [uncultured Rubrobacteraceae bacterium]
MGFKALTESDDPLSGPALRKQIEYRRGCDDTLGYGQLRRKIENPQQGADFDFFVNR